MAIKVFFVGNLFGGDDGIGPLLYNMLKDEMKDETKSRENNAQYRLEMVNIGVSSVDMIEHIHNCSKVIIVDALKSENGEGDVVLIKEDMLINDKNKRLFSQHDLGVAQTVGLMKYVNPELEIIIAGIKVSKVGLVSEGMSKELKDKVPEIKEEIKKIILNNID